MFNWFRKKIELKNNNAIANSIDYKHGIKLGSEISVPCEFECLIFSKGKYFTTLKDGKYKIDDKVLPKLIKAQQKNAKKPKAVKLVAHYISTRNHELQIIAKKQKYKIDFCIKSNLKFTELILTFNYKIDDTYVLNYLQEIFHELLLFNKFNCDKITNTALESYGIYINEFKPLNTKKSMFSSKNNAVIEETSLPVMPVLGQSSNTKDEIEQSVEQKQSEPPTPSTTPQAKLYTCPNCGQATKFKTTYCIKCGTPLSDT